MTSAAIAQRSDANSSGTAHASALSADWSDNRERALDRGSDFLVAIDRILPSIEAVRDESERQGRVPDSTVQAMIDAGAFRAFTPTQWGGLEMPPAAFFEGMMKVAEADSAAAWIGGQLNVHSFEIALMDPRMQEEFWGDSPDTRASSSYAPVGKVRAVDGGCELNGTWTFSSGVDHAQWVILGGGDRNFVVPMKDYTVDHDSWDVSGLKGTGSKSVTLENVFVPDYRTHRLIDTYNDANPGWAVNDRPLYWLSFIGMFNSTPANTAVGTAKGGIRTFIEQSRVRLSRQGTGAAVINNPFMHLKVADAICKVRGVRERHLANWRGLFDDICRGKQASPLVRMRLRFEVADAIAASFDAIAELWPIAGAAASASSNPMQRTFRDLMAARNHGSAAREAAAGLYIRTLFDMPAPPFTDMGTLAYCK